VQNAKHNGKGEMMGTKKRKENKKRYKIRNDRNKEEKQEE
jgi:hypothetical protein